MENHFKTPKNNREVEGYKVPGDGNLPNESPEPGNQTFEENPAHPVQKDAADIPGQEFNLNDKAYFDSSKEDFVKTVSQLHHAHPDLNTEVDLSYKKPDGDR